MLLDLNRLVSGVKITSNVNSTSKKTEKLKNIRTVI